MISDYKFFIKEKVLQKLRDPHFSGLSGTAIFYIYPKNYKFKESIFDGDELLKEVRIATGGHKTPSLFKKPVPPKAH